MISKVVFCACNCSENDNDEDDNDQTNILKSFRFLASLGIFIWGWVWYTMIDECEPTPMKKLMFAHLIYESIIFGLLIILFLLFFTAYGTLILLEISDAMSNDNGLNEDELAALEDFIYATGVNQNGVNPEDLEEDSENDNGTTIREHKIDDSQDQGCCICLENYEEGDSLRVLNCKHHFHKQCLDTWLLRNNSCPLCREPAIAPTQDPGNVV